ncbi:MAG: NINE protein, partial [Acidobacteriota bacterium]|nr:NINE protein [Acidobacteriota bacterium]
MPGYVPPAGPYAPPAAVYLDPTAKSKLVGGLLGILLGGLGIHRFYLGYTNIGIAQLATDIIGWVLLPFTCGISLVFIMAAHIWGLVDGIRFLT